MAEKQKLTKYDIRFFGLMVTCFALVFVLPEPRSTEPGIVNGFIRLMTSIIPSINQWAEGSKFPQLTRLYLSILWSVTPVMSWLLLKNANFQPKEQQQPVPLRPIERRQAAPVAHGQSQNRRKTSKPVLILAGIFLCSLMYFMVYFSVFHGFLIEPSDYHSSSRDAFVTLAPRQSKLWLGLLATAACSAVAFCLATFYLLISNCVFYVRFKLKALFRKQ